MPTLKKTVRRASRAAHYSPRLARAQRILRAHLPELRAQYAVKPLGIFGSYMRGAEHPRSDLDVLVEFERTPTLLEFVRLKRYLSHLTGIPVDLVLKKTLKPHIGRYILAEVIPVE